MKVLVTVDGSRNAIKGLEKAIEYAKQNTAELILINVQEDERANVSYGWPALVHSKHDLGQAAARVLEDAEKIIQPSGLKYEKVVEFGDTAHMIIEYAEKEKVDVIVMGSRGLTGVTKFLLGSVASKVVTYAPCTVIVVK
jgi:nucleotide-binding universal stress UspA family protein